jgi:hypothetical protein
VVKKHRHGYQSSRRLPVVADRKLTLFEIHLDDATFTANATTTEGGGSPGDEAERDDEDEAAGCPAKRAGKALVGLAVLAVVALVAARLLGEEAMDEDLAALADLDDE